MSVKKILIFNWKMAPQSLSEAKRLLTNYKRPITNNEENKKEIVVASPSVYLVYLSSLSSVVGRKSSVKLGAQDVFYENSGAYTGEISPKMLKNLGVKYVIIGHSERRKYLGETDEMINKKVLAVLKAGLKVILCVGEPTRSIKYKVESIKQAKNYIKKQLEKDLKKVSNIKYQVSRNLIVAYEPVWAISGSHSDTPEDALEMIKYIKQTLNSKFYILNSRVLYGGSVNSKNIGDFLKRPEIDGALIGHASLKVEEVKKIIEIASKIV